MKMASAFFAIALTTALLTVAHAADGESPPFFDGTALYSTDLSACPVSANNASDETIGESLQISSAGIYGSEFACTFVSFHAEKDPESKLIYSWVAVAQCGDDSGINRPDLMTIIHDEEQDILRVQSQNEYVLGEMAARQPNRNPNKDPFEETSYVSGDYKRCPKT